MMGKKEKAHLLTKGARVQLCPYQENRIYKFLGHMDGERGTVEEVGVEPNPYGPSQVCVLVAVDGGLGPISFPDGALRAIREP